MLRVRENNIPQDSVGSRKAGKKGAYISEERAWTEGRGIVKEKRSRVHGGRGYDLQVWGLWAERNGKLDGLQIEDWPGDLV